MAAIKTRIGVLPDAFKLGEYVITPSRREISGNGQTARISPRSLGVLLELTKRPGQTISHDVLLKNIWGEVIVSDEVLFKAISELRRVFADNPSRPRVIKTIPKTGYQLLLTPKAVGQSPKYIWALAGALVLTAGIWLSLNPTERTAKPEAVVLLDKAQYLIEHGDTETALQAMEWLNQASELDPDHAEIYGWMARLELYQLADWISARKSADTALALNPNSVNALLVRSQIALEREWDWDISRQLLDRALKIEPENPLVLIGLAAWHTTTGQHSKAMTFAQQAVAYDPVNAILRGDLAFIYYMAGNTQSMLEEANQLLELDPGNPFALSMKMDVLARQNRIPEARPIGNTILHQYGVSELDMAKLATVEDSAYQEHYLELIKGQLSALQDQQPIVMASILAQLEETDQVLSLLSIAIHQQTPYLPYLAVDPHFTALRNDSGFIQLLAQAGHPLALQKMVMTRQTSSNIRQLALSKN